MHVYAKKQAKSPPRQPTPHRHDCCGDNEQPTNRFTEDDHRKEGADDTLLLWFPSSASVRHSIGNLGANLAIRSLNKALLD